MQVFAQRIELEKELESNFNWHWQKPLDTQICLIQIFVRFCNVFEMKIVKKNRVMETIGYKETRWAQRARGESPSFCVSCWTLSISTNSLKIRKNIQPTDFDGEFSAESIDAILTKIYLKTKRWWKLIEDHRQNVTRPTSENRPYWQDKIFSKKWISHISIEENVIFLMASLKNGCDD